MRETIYALLPHLWDGTTRLMRGTKPRRSNDPMRPHRLRHRGRLQTLLGRPPRPCGLREGLHPDCSYRRPHRRAFPLSPDRLAQAGQRPVHRDRLGRSTVPRLAGVQRPDPLLRAQSGLRHRQHLARPAGRTGHHDGGQPIGPCPLAECHPARFIERLADAAGKGRQKYRIGENGDGCGIGGVCLPRC